MSNVTLRYKHYDLGPQPLGTVVEIALSCVNNVRLLDASNIALYKENKAYRFNGGLVQKTPARLTVPRNGHWHVVVDKEGLNALANSKVRIIRPAGTENWTMASEGTGQPEATNQQSVGPAATIASVSNTAGNNLGMPKAVPNISTDGLTGLPNRDAFEDRLVRLYEAGIDLSAHAAIVLSINNLKEFNDKFGRAAGDEALETISAAIRKSVNGNDFVARTGGLEFAVLTKCGTEEIAKTIAERIATTIGAQELTAKDSGEPYGKLSASYGTSMASAASDAASFFTMAQSSLSQGATALASAYATG